jgi:hypothetical protein
VFYDSLEMAPPTSYTPPPLPPFQSSQQEAHHTAPPMTTTLPAPFPSSSHQNLIFTTYNAGRPALTHARAVSPPTTYSSQTSSLHFSAPVPAFSTNKPQARGWEAASDAERREVGDYKQRFSQLVAQTREREREWDERLLRMTQKLDAQARRTRWFLVAIATFAVLWPGLARAIERLLTWLWPLVRNRLRK